VSLIRHELEPVRIEVERPVPQPDWAWPQREAAPEPPRPFDWRADCLADVVPPVVVGAGRGHLLPHH
jgi:hypothetical protein